MGPRSGMSCRNRTGPRSGTSPGDKRGGGSRAGRGRRVGHPGGGGCRSSVCGGGRVGDGTGGRRVGHTSLFGDPVGGGSGRGGSPLGGGCRDLAGWCGPAGGWPMSVRLRFKAGPGLGAVRLIGGRRPVGVGRRMVVGGGGGRVGLLQYVCRRESGSGAAHHCGSLLLGVPPVGGRHVSGTVVSCHPRPAGSKPRASNQPARYGRWALGR
jgi:hypothetical protein